MALNSCDESLDDHSISLLHDEGSTKAQCNSQFGYLNILEVQNSSESYLGTDILLNNPSYSKKMESDVFSPYDVNIDIEKGSSEIPKTKNETVEKLKTEGPLTMALDKQISIQIGETFVQLLMNHSHLLPKFVSKDKLTTEKIHDTPNNRARKFKRTASFNSRKVVLLFSALSSMGTMILIYLTLRVKQIGDGFAHV